MPLSLSLTAPFRRTTAGSPSGFSNPPLLHSRSLQLNKFRSAKSVSGFRVFAKQNEFPAIRRPDSKGFFGKHGGSHCPDSMLPALSELESAYESLSSDPDFQVEALVADKTLKVDIMEACIECRRRQESENRSAADEDHNPSVGIVDKIFRWGGDGRRQDYLGFLEQ
ncbi:hypothetical protein Lser_V15G35322 [Lactuca serriola]